MRTSLLPAAAALVTSALLLTGCGGGSSSDDNRSASGSTSPSDSPAPSDPSGSSASFADQDAASIVAQAKAATTSVSSVHLAGTATSDGQEQTLDLQLDSKGDCTGSIGFGDRGSADILGTGGTYWFRPDATFWRSFAGSKADAIIAKVGRKYVVNPDLAQSCDLSGYFTDDSQDAAPPAKEGTATVDGQETVKVTTTDADGQASTGYVLVSEPHYVVKVESGGSAPGTFTLTDFGQDFSVQAPPAGQQITEQQLGAGS